MSSPADFPMGAESPFVVDVEPADRPALRWAALSNHVSMAGVHTMHGVTPAVIYTRCPHGHTVGALAPAPPTDSPRPAIDALVRALIAHEDDGDCRAAGRRP